MPPDHPYQELRFPDDDREPVTLEPYVSDEPSPTFVPFSEYDPANPFAPSQRRRRNQQRNPVAASRWKHAGRRHAGPTIPPRTRVRESHRGQAGHRRSTTAARSGDSGDDGPAEPAAASRGRWSA